MLDGVENRKGCIYVSCAGEMGICSKWKIKINLFEIRFPAFFLSKDEV